jgi:hypothetical protein
VFSLAAATPDDGVLSNPPEAFLRAPSTDATAQTAESIPIYCSPLRESSTHRVRNELALNSLRAEQDNTSPIAEPTKLDVRRLEEPILDALIELFYSSIYPSFPIIGWHSFQSQYDRWLSAWKDGESTDEDDTEFYFSYMHFSPWRRLLSQRNIKTSMNQAWKHING